MEELCYAILYYRSIKYGEPIYENSHVCSVDEISGNDVVLDASLASDAGLVLLF
jgi:hypothetical protein